MQHHRIAGLIAAEVLLVACGLVLLLGDGATAMSPASGGAFVGFAAVFTLLVLLPPVYLELRRHSCWLTPADCAIMIGLFLLGPLGFVAAAMAAEAISTWKHRQPPLKRVFNVVHMFGGYVAGAFTFQMLGRTDPFDPVAWLGGAAAVAAVAVWDLVSTTAVLAIAEGQRFLVMLRKLAPAGLVSLTLSALLGTAALVLWNETVLGPLLFAPVLLVLLISTRGVSRQRAERLRLQRLYEASSGLTRLLSMSDTLTMVASEARGLVTGAVALCATQDPNGAWTGVLVDDDGSEAAPAASLAAVAALASRERHGEQPTAQLDGPARRALPDCVSLVWASADLDQPTPVLLAVFREVVDEDDQRADVLSAFATHAAAVVANVGLHEDVQRALDRQVELNRQKSEFVASVSHELRTPLASMLGSVQTVKRLGDRIGDEDRDRMLDLGLSQGQRLKTLIEDLLLVAAADHKEVTCMTARVDVGGLFEDLAADVAPVAGDRLILSAGPDVGMVQSDPDKLRRILVNLVQNAAKYAPAGPIEVAARREADRLVLSVTDEGPGIPPADRERVFERFVQLDQSSTRRQGGTGLGLHLCRELASLLQASLSVTDGPRGGARFVLELPLAVEARDGVAPRRLAGRTSGPVRSAMRRPAVLSRPVIPSSDGSDDAIRPRTPERMTA